METAQIQEFLKEVLATHETHSNCYFWNGIGSATARRTHEQKHTQSMDFDFQGVNYSISQDVSCSCNHTYYTLKVKANGVSKDVRAVKKLNALLNEVLPEN